MFKYDNVYYRVKGTPLRCKMVRLVRRGAKSYGRQTTLRSGAKRNDRFGTVRNGTVCAVHCQMVQARRCNRNGVVRSDTVRRLQCGKLYGICGAVVRCGAVRFNSVLSDEVR